MTPEHILADGRWNGPHGIARFAREIYARLPPMQWVGGTPLFHPLDPLSLGLQTRRAGCKAFFTPGFNPPLFEKVPLVLTVHDLNYVYFPDNSDAMRRAYFRYLVRPACRRAHKVLTVSQFSRSHIMQWADVGADRVLNVGCGVSGAFQPSGERHQPGYPYVLMVGQDRPHKNVQRSIRAFAQSGLNREMKLLIAGDLRPQTWALADSLGLNGSVVALGSVSEERLPPLYRGAAALCMPSLFEGFGLPVVEAMACGVPVLASTATSLPEVAGDAAVLLDPLDVDRIAEGLQRVVSDSALRAQLRLRGIERAAQFSWQRTVNSIRKVLDDL